MKRIFAIGILCVVSLFLFSSLAFAVANTCTSKTGTVSGTDGTFAVTYRPNASAGAILYIKYTKGSETGITLTFDTVNRALSTTDVYRYPVLSGTAMSAYTMVITATGNYRIPLPLIPSEMKLVANVVFASTNSGGVAVVNFTEP
jgi:hypothetical protein